MPSPKVTYTLASRANYKFNIVRMGYSNYDDVSYLYKSDFPDVEVTRPGYSTSLGAIHNKFLITLNGYVHNTVYSEGRLYIPGATKCMLHSRLNMVGLINLGSVAPSLTKTPITLDMVSSELNQLTYDKVIITMPTPVEQPLLIMGGYIVPYNEQSFYRISDTAFALCLSKLQYTEKLYELGRYRRIFEELGVTVSPLNPEAVDANELRSELVIRKFLSLGNSFMVDLKTAPLVSKKIYLEHSSVPSSFRTEIEPILPMFVGYGKLCEYSLDQTGLKYLVTTQDTHYNNHLFSSIPQRDLTIMNANRQPGNTYTLSEAFFLELTV